MEGMFFPPYSILYWYTRSAEGSLEAELRGEMYIMDTLLSYPNVSVYYFQNMYDFITDLDNYSDYTHYTHKMNDYMMECFADEGKLSGSYGRNAPPDVGIRL